MSSTHESLNAAALWFICRFGFMLTELLRWSAFGGRDPSPYLRRASEAGEIEWHNKHNSRGTLPGGVGWCRPLAKGCAKAGVPADRGANISAEATRQRLAVAWASCAYPDEPLYRLEAEEFVSVFGTEPPPANVAWLLSSECVFRAYVPETDVSGCVGQVRSIRDAALDNPKFRPAVQTGQLGIAVLCPTPMMCASVAEALRERLAGGPPTDQTVRVLVRLGPSADTVSEAIREWRRARGSRD